MIPDSLSITLNFGIMWTSNDMIIEISDCMCALLSEFFH